MELKITRRQAINLSETRLVQEELLHEGQNLPLVLKPAVSGVHLASWASSNLAFLEEKLLKHGGILFRDFDTDTPEKFEQFAKAIRPELFAEYGDLPRASAGEKIYTSTPYPADKSILYHNESSHLHRWPMKQWFYCVTPAPEGGATPVVDCRTMCQLLDPQVLEEFERKQLMYVRNFIEGLDVSWQRFFQTDKKEVVEAYCRDAGIDCEWKSDNHLTTRRVCQAVTRHPKTGERIFFNQIQLHHIACLDPEVRTSLIDMFGMDALPRNVYFGDGSTIDDAVVEHVGEIYEKAAVRFNWQAGDILMLDNMLVAHARDPFSGPRKILVAMADVDAHTSNAN